MERITAFDGEFWVHKNSPPVGEDTVDEFIDCVKELAARLAAYEDTGLEPEAIIALCDMDKRAKMADLLRLEEYQSLGTLEHLRRLAQAEKEGRVVVLPCKIGDTVYHITTCEHFVQILDGTMYGPDGGPGTATGYYCPCELLDNCPFDAEDFDCDRNKKVPAIFTDTIAGAYINCDGINIELDYSGNVCESDFGKSVFLTREEAEAALKEKQK